MRLLGLPTYELDDDGRRALAALTQEGRELLSVLASNAAQMYMGAAGKQLWLAMERCSVAIEAVAGALGETFGRSIAPNVRGVHFMERPVLTKNVEYAINGVKKLPT